MRRQAPLISAFVRRDFLLSRAITRRRTSVRTALNKRLLQAKGISTQTDQLRMPNCDGGQAAKRVTRIRRESVGVHTCP